MLLCTGGGTAQRGSVVGPDLSLRSATKRPHDLHGKTLNLSAEIKNWQRYTKRWNFKKAITEIIV